MSASLFSAEYSARSSLCCAFTSLNLPCEDNSVYTLVCAVFAFTNNMLPLKSSNALLWILLDMLFIACRVN